MNLEGFRVCLKYLGRYNESGRLIVVSSMLLICCGLITKLKYSYFSLSCHMVFYWLYFVVMDHYSSFT